MFLVCSGYVRPCRVVRDHKEKLRPRAVLDSQLEILQPRLTHRKGVFMLQKLWSLPFVVAVSLAWQGPASAWGDEGHEIIALIAQAYLSPAASRQVNALLAA